MDGRIGERERARGSDESADVITMRMRDEDIGHACRVLCGRGHGPQQLAGDLTEVAPGTGVEQQQVATRMHQQRLNAELEVVAWSAATLECRGDLGGWLSDDEALAVVRLLKCAVLERQCAVAADLERLVLHSRCR